MTDFAVVVGVGRYPKLSAEGVATDLACRTTTRWPCATGWLTRRAASSCRPTSG